MKSGLFRGRFPLRKPVYYCICAVLSVWTSPELSKPDLYTKLRPVHLLSVIANKYVLRFFPKPRDSLAPRLSQGRLRYDRLIGSHRPTSLHAQSNRPKMCLGRRNLPPPYRMLPLSVKFPHQRRFDSTDDANSSEAADALPDQMLWSRSPPESAVDASRSSVRG